MGRIRKNVKIDGKECWTLFDSGAENTYVVPKIAKPFSPRKLRRQRRAHLGGKVHTLTHVCVIEALVERRPVEVKAFVIDKIGTDKKARRPFELLFGALEMQNWGIDLELKKEQLDLSAYPKEFVEFMEGDQP